MTIEYGLYEINKKAIDDKALQLFNIYIDLMKIFDSSDFISVNRPIRRIFGFLLEQISEDLYDNHGLVIDKSGKNESLDADGYIVKTKVDVKVDESNSQVLTANGEGDLAVVNSNAYKEKSALLGTLSEIEKALPVYGSKIPTTPEGIRAVKEHEILWFYLSSLDFEKLPSYTEFRKGMFGDV